MPQGSQRYSQKRRQIRRVDGDLGTKEEHEEERGWIRSRVSPLVGRQRTLPARHSPCLDLRTKVTGEPVAQHGMTNQDDKPINQKGQGDVPPVRLPGALS